MEESQHLNQSILTISETDRITFPLNLSLGAYDLSEYTSDQTNNLLSKDEVEEFFVTIYQITEHFKTVKPGYTIKRISIFLGIFILLFGGTFGAAFFLLSEDQTISEVLSLILISMSIFITLLFFIILVACNILANNRCKKIRKKIQKIIDQNNPPMKEKGLKWALPKDHFNWMELWIEKKISPKKTSVL